MAADNSFDIVSKVDIQEVRNAVDQAIKEVRARFDLKDSHSDIKIEGNDTLQLASADEYKLKAGAETGQARNISQGPDVRKDRTRGKQQRPAEDQAAARHSAGKGQRHCAHA